MLESNEPKSSVSPNATLRKSGLINVAQNNAGQQNMTQKTSINDPNNLKNQMRQTKEAEEDASEDMASFVNKVVELHIIDKNGKTVHTHHK